MYLKSSILLVLSAALAGCATLPTNGPTGGQIKKSAQQQLNGLPIKLVQVENLANVPLARSIAPEAPGAPEPPAVPTDTLGPGDILDINIYEAGVTLFSGNGGDARGGMATALGVQVQKLPPVRVDDDGYISIPYAGRLQVVGHTVREAEAMIRAALQGISQNPQVLISMQEAITNSVIVGGEVAKSGRLVLQTNRERLTDVIALAGGYRGNTKDLLARVFHGDDISDIRLNDLVDNPSSDMRIYPGDRIMLINDPRTYSVLGAAGQVAQLPFSRSSVTLAEAIATAGGVNPSIGNPAAIFLFRYVKDEQGVEVPVVYHLNMMKAGTFFLAQRFTMRDKDVLYFGNAAANQPSKLVQLISQLFAPILTVTSAVQTLQN
ncbi:polysaccharide biosynthesis/export family protein [Sphingobium subterraneum]|uniref:Polysaccharide export outer membrane protein n=1 Tax=Sphingobium subterraneum TaxID=627688 RepID=A0A841IXR3_9SPHN|nr:polysaccharide biosynthesis/export family protein [Sphingobium subterraneum]MBB6123739.1 polysaccharide export outer membrane protein [Sphingobium subterraneum]